jgi:outer membrane usher protein FimD/PapC
VGVLRFGSVAAIVAAAASGWQPAVAADAEATSINLPVIVDGQPSSGIEAFVSGDRLIGLRAEDVARALTGLADRKIVEALRARDGARITPSELRSLGITTSFDLASLLIRIDLNASSRAPQQFGFAAERDNAAEQVPAAKFAAGITAALTNVHNFGAPIGDSTALEFSGFANAGGKGGYYLLYSGAYRIAGRQKDFERGQIVAFKDDLRRVLRYSAGDLLPLMPQLVGDVGLAGLGIERRYDDIQPLRNVRPTGARSFVIERPSRIEVYANGALVKSFDAAPGVVDLRDIPALALSSNISVVVEDSFGRRELDSFTLSNDLSMLAPGLSEFTFDAGLLRDSGFSGMHYTGRAAAVGAYRRGIAEDLTAGGHFAVASGYQNFGGDLAIATLNGILTGSFSVAHGSRGTGGAISVDFRGDPFGLQSRNGQLTLRADARSRGFQTLSTFGFDDRTKLDLEADYRFDLRRRLSATLGGNYFSTYDSPGANWSVFAGIQANLYRLYVTATARLARRANGDRDDGFLFTLSLPLGRKHLVTATAETSTGRARVDFRRRPDLSVPYVDYAATVVRDPRYGSEATIEGRYGNSRFETAGYLTQHSNDYTTSIVKVQTGLAFVDGKVALGRDPGRGFVVVSRHSSLKGTAIDVFSNGTGRRAGQVNALGSAVIPQMGPYRPDTVTFNLLDPPLGYDVGAGKFQTDVGAFTGEHIRIGTDAYHSAIGILVTPQGNRLSLRYGVIEAADGKVTPIFTNGAGRAVFGELAPGRYTLELEGYRAEFLVKKDSPTVIELGTVVMEKTQ